MKLTAALGLAQNLAALRTIVINRIQRDYMYLQLHSLAMTAGAGELPLVTVCLRRLKRPNLERELR